uniref:Uncharacterized protein n=1 Tax=Apteryx owenii TaxID=8824 RepID=A0A8B9PFX4_APTOW
MKRGIISILSSCDLAIVDAQLRLCTGAPWIGLSSQKPKGLQGRWVVGSTWDPHPGKCCQLIPAMGNPCPRMLQARPGHRDPRPGMRCQCGLAAGTPDPGCCQLCPAMGTPDPGCCKLVPATGTPDPGCCQLCLAVGTPDPGCCKLVPATGTPDPGCAASVARPQGPPPKDAASSSQPQGPPTRDAAIGACSISPCIRAVYREVRLRGREHIGGERSTPSHPANQQLIFLALIPL